MRRAAKAMVVQFGAYSSTSSIPALFYSTIQLMAFAPNAAPPSAPVLREAGSKVELDFRTTLVEQPNVASSNASR